MNITAQMDVSKLKHHPKNPRKDLGDLEELTKSIKANGIMQNLTIIPINGAGNCTTWENAVEYWVLIGNRRFEAAKRAGLDKVPCTIVENISEREQISIMLEENMQRTDLTPVEQAEGFQLMLDLGETVETIVEKTGFNKATVYHRLNLAKLDRKSLKEKQEAFQLSLADLYTLEQIKNVSTRNRILQEATSSNDIRIKAEIEAEKEKFMDYVREATKWLNQKGIDKAGKEYENSKWSKTTNKNSTYQRWLILYELSLKEGFTPPKEDIPEGTFFEITEWYRTLRLIVEHPHYGEQIEREETPKEIEERKQREEKQEKENRLKQLADDFKETFRTFLLGFLSGEIKAPMNLRNICQYNYMWERLTKIGVEVLPDDLAKNYNELYKEIEKPEYQLSDSEIKRLYNKAAQLTVPEQMLLYIFGSLRWRRDTVDYQGRYDDEDALVYKECKKILEAFEMSVDEETTKMIDGTHSYYSPNE